MNRTDVHGTLREMWETRPARPRDDRQVAGVASAIARRYDLDPVLVRIAFVAAAFTGIGAALYIAGWIALPETPEDPAAPAHRPRPVLVVGLAVAAAVSIGFLFSDRGGVVVPTLAVLALLFLLHRSRGERVARPVPAADAPTVATEPAAAGPSLVKPGPSLVKEVPEPTPPAWDPLGAAPFAWDLPEPGPAQPPAAPQRPRRFPVTAVTLGLALLAGSATAGLLLLMGAFVASNVPLVLGVVLGVIGAGLVVGAFLRTGRGLIPIALLLSALTWAAVAAPLDRWEAGGFGDLNATPTTLAELRPTYQRSAGDITLDLRQLPLTGTGQVATEATLGAGDLTVLVPADTDVKLDASAGLGDVSLGGQKVSGPGAKLDVEDLGADKVRSGQELVLTLSSGAGDVEVRRG